MTPEPSPGNEISGTYILREVRAAYMLYRDLIAPQDKRVVIVRFEAASDAPADWQRRMNASRVSAEQKVRAFGHLGYQTEHIVLPPHASTADFGRLINRCNQDPQVSAIIVQFPPPSRLRGLVQDIAPAKDIDALLVKNSPHEACATADGVLRIVEPFTEQAVIAVVGARGFVGQGVVRLLQASGHEPLQLDAGDDLTRVRDADIVISVTGQPGVLGADHVDALVSGRVHGEQILEEAVQGPPGDSNLVVQLDEAPPWQTAHRVVVRPVVAEVVEHRKDRLVRDRAGDPDEVITIDALLQQWSGHG